MTRRAFNNAERIALYLAASGRCSLCGVELTKGWHADHINPYSRGGATDVVNGQALCPECNLKKGCRSMNLREWQALCVSNYAVDASKDFLVEATPGAGKTMLAGAIMDQHVKTWCNQVVVVVPTTALKKQWADSLRESFSIQLECDWKSSSGPFPKDMHGVVVTYAQVSSNPDLFRRNVSCGQTFVVFDEIHHCGVESAWGKSCSIAFEPAKRRLCLSGTPFRSNQREQIPFVRYVDGWAAPDFQYGYADALSDGICRSIFFPRVGGRMEWITPIGEHREATFDDELRNDELNQRLRTCLSADGDWMTDTIQSAHKSLLEMRKTDPNAAGLIIAGTQTHAQAIAQRMSALLQVEPVVVVSDDPTANTQIERFRDSDEPWIVAVKMVSEGVDIKRLRVGVYATVCTTEMFFRQAVGRFVRVESDHDDHTADVYIPDDVRIREMAENIRQAVMHHITDQMEDDENESNGGATCSSTLFGFMPISSTASNQGVIYNDQGITPDELNNAARLLERCRLSGQIKPAQAALLLRETQCAIAPVDAVPPPVNKSDIKNKLRSSTNAIAKKIAFKGEIEFSHVNKTLNDLAGIVRVTDSTTEEQLRVRKKHAVDWAKRLGVESNA